MTRWARGGPANKKKEHDATPWGKMEQQQAGNHKAHSKYKKQEIEDNKNSIPVTDIKKPKASSVFEKLDDDMFNEKLTSNETVSSGLAAELEKIATHTGVEESVISVTKRKARKKKTHKQSKEKNQLLMSSVTKDFLKTDLTAKLTSLKKTLMLNPGEVKEIDGEIQKDQRREKRRLKRIDTKSSGKTCFNCRKTGHTFADCPDADQDHAVSGICFKCGSTEHTIARCKAKVQEGYFPYAKCFICGEQGHMSRQCPDNPRGLYPKGGCCKTCGSVEHYNKDCTELQQQQGIQNYTLKRFTKNHHNSVDEEVFDEDIKVHKLFTKRPKVVKF